MQKLIVLYYYPKYLILGILLPAFSYLTYIFIFDKNVDIFLLKLILYFGFIFYLSFLAYKNYERSNIQVNLTLVELQSIYFLLNEAEIYGSSEKIKEDIYYYLSS